MDEAPEYVVSRDAVVVLSSDQRAEINEAWPRSGVGSL